MKQEGPIILASASPRRRDFFHLLGLKIDVVPSDAPEPEGGGNPHRLPLWMTIQKLKNVRPKLGKEFRGWIVAADTIVALGREVFGKPKDRRQAAEMLSRLAGKRHKVYTGYRVQNAAGKYREGVAETAVELAPMTEGEIEWYVSTGEPADKAGAYAIQGKGGLFVRSIFGSYSNVVGLPLHEVVTALRELGAIRI
jgi:septum formation protein